MSFFKHDLLEGYDLVLSDLQTAQALHDLSSKNRDRLKRWEQWAQGEPGPRDDDFMMSNLRAYIEGLMIPCAIRAEEVPIGSISLRLDDSTGNGELGYWIDSAHEGRGVVRRAAEALISYAFEEREIDRLEIRTSSHNLRSRALAERLGFQFEGELRQGHLVGSERHDVAIYGRLRE